MNQSKQTIRKYLKHGLAGALFIAVLCGASAVAMAVLAFGVQALNQPTTSSGSDFTQQAAANVAGASVPYYTGSDAGFVYSPVGDAIDNGGVVLGDRLQHAFGYALSGMLQALFLDQADGNSANSSQTGGP